MKPVGLFVYIFCYHVREQTTGESVMTLDLKDGEDCSLLTSLNSVSQGNNRTIESTGRSVGQLPCCISKPPVASDCNAKTRDKTET